MISESIRRVDKWECLSCHEEHYSEAGAVLCATRCAQAEAATEAFSRGEPLSEVVKNFPENCRPDLKALGLEGVTKTCGFVVGHWQCCDLPAYAIIRFTNTFRPFLWGKGGWTGCYGGEVNWKDLGKPSDTIYVDPR